MTKILKTGGILAGAYIAARTIASLLPGQSGEEDASKQAFYDFFGPSEAIAAETVTYKPNDFTFKELSGKVSNGQFVIDSKQSYIVKIEKGDNINDIADSLVTSLKSNGYNFSREDVVAKLRTFNSATYNGKENPWQNQYWNSADVDNLRVGDTLAIVCGAQVEEIPGTYKNGTTKSKGTTDVNTIPDVCKGPCDSIDGTRKDGRLVPVGEYDAVVSEIMNVKKALVEGNEYNGVKLTRDLAEGMVSGILKENHIVTYVTELKDGEKPLRLLVFEKDKDCIAFDGYVVADPAREILDAYFNGGKTDNIFFDEKLFSSTGNYIPGMVIIPNGVEASRISARHNEKPEGWTDRTPEVNDDSDGPCEVYKLEIKRLIDEHLNGNGHGPGGPGGCNGNGPGGGAGHGMLMPAERNYVADALNERVNDVFAERVNSFNLIDNKEINTRFVYKAENLRRVA